MNDELEKFWLNFSGCKSNGSFIEQLGSTEFGNRTISNSYKTEEIKGNRILSSIELEDGIKYRKKVVLLNVTEPKIYNNDTRLSPNKITRSLVFLQGCLYCSSVIVFSLRIGSRRTRKNRNSARFYSRSPGASSQPILYCASLLRENFWKFLLISSDGLERRFDEVRLSLEIERSRTLFGSVSELSRVLSFGYQTVRVVTSG